MKYITQFVFEKHEDHLYHSDEEHDKERRFHIRDDTIIYSPNIIKDGKYLITVARAEKKRTLPQLRYLFGVVYKTIADHTGHTVDEIHQYFKQLYMTKIAQVGSLPLAVTRSLSDSSDVTIDELTQYIESVRAYGYNELGLTFPDDPVSID
jgi:hypothetical protein